MDTSIQQVEVGNSIIKYEWCPGNGTRYEILVAKLLSVPHLSCGSLGAVTDGWLVVSGLNRLAYMFQPVGDIHTSYIKEKFELGFEGDVKYMTKLISFAINRPYIQ